MGNGVLVDSKDFYGNLKKFNGFWDYKGLLGILWDLKKFKGILRDFMGSQGI